MNAQPQPIPIDLLDSQIHETYNNEITNPQIRRTHLLAILQTMAYVRQLGRTLGVATANAHSATAGIIQPLKNLITAEGETFQHLQFMLNDFYRATRTNTEHNAHIICLAVIDELKKLPEEGILSEIDATKRIIASYERPTATTPSTPIPEQTPIPIPAPRMPHMEAAASRLLKLFEKKKSNNNLMEEDGSDKENINPNTKVSNIHDEDIVEEVHRLEQYISTLATVPTPKEFVFPPDYVTWVAQPDKETTQRYLKVIMTAFLNKNIQHDKYRGQQVTYAQIGPDNARHFIGFSEVYDKWMMADTKKKLFGTIVTMV